MAAKPAYAQQPPGHGSDLLAAIVDEDVTTVQVILKDVQMAKAMVNWQDELGWTPLIYAAFKGESKLVKKLLNRGAAVNHMALSRAGSSADGTTALHACAAMRGARANEDAFYETARVLMLAGGNPYQENLSGLTPIDVAANRSNVDMKMLLEGCALFKGVLNLPVPKLFGGKSADRYCIVLPRFPWAPLGSQQGLLMRDGSPRLALVCYKQPEDLKPVIQIPLDGARVVVEGGVADEGFLILKAARKQLKGVVVKTSNSSSSVVEIRARPSGSQTGAQVLQALAEVLKSAAVAAYCGNLGQLCEATMVESLHNLGLADGLLVLPRHRAAAEREAAQALEKEPSGDAGDTASDAESSKGRKSLSSRIGKAFRRLSMGDKPKLRRSGSSDSSGGAGMLPEIYPYSKTKRAAAASQADFTRISEEGSEQAGAPVDWTKISRELPPVQRPSGRMSLQQDSRRPSKASSDARRQSLQLRSSQSREWLTSNHGIPMAFWGDMRSELVRGSLDGRPKPPNGENPRAPMQAPDVRASFDVGEQQHQQQHQQQRVPHPPQQSAATRTLAAMEAQRPGQAGGRQAPLPPDSWKRPPAVPSVLLAHKLQAPPAVPSVLFGHSTQMVPSPRPATPPAASQAAAAVAAPSTPPPVQSRPSSEEERSPVPTAAAAPAPAAPSAAKPPAGAAAKPPGSRPPAAAVAPAPAAAALAPAAAPAAVMAPAAAKPQVERSPRPVAPPAAKRQQQPQPQPRPAAKASGSNASLFGSSARSSDDLFQWSLRPESGQRQAAAAAAAAAQAAAQAKAAAQQKPGSVDPAVARWAAEAAAQVKGEPGSSGGIGSSSNIGVTQLAAAGRKEAGLTSKQTPEGRFKVMPGNALPPEPAAAAATAASEQPPAKMARPSKMRASRSNPSLAGSEKAERPSPLLATSG